MSPLTWLPAGLAAFALCVSSATAAFAEDLPTLKSQGELILDDDFNRTELGEQWQVNDGRARKAGDLQSQAQLLDGVLQIRRSPKANHGASVRTEVEFTDAVIEVELRLPDENATFAVNLNDTAWGRRQSPKRFGHLCRVQVGAKHVLIEDQKTPGLDEEFIKLKESGASKDELARWKDRTVRATFPAEVAPDKWHTLAIVVAGDSIRVSLDGKPIGHFSSPGFAHPTKQMMAFAVPEAADAGELKIWKLR